MTQTAPLLINPLIFAQRHARFVGEVAVRELPRLLPALADAKGDIHYDIQFQQDDERQLFVIVTWQTPVILVCQRCLQPFTLDLQHTSRLQVVADELKLEQLADDVEPLVLNPHTHDFHLLALLTDEILLQLPPVPKHPVDLCPARVTEAREEQQPAQQPNPFADLRKLMDREDP